MKQLNNCKHKIKATEVPLKTNGERAINLKYQQSLRYFFKQVAQAGSRWKMMTVEFLDQVAQLRNWCKCSHNVFKKANSVFSLQLLS